MTPEKRLQRDVLLAIGRDRDVFVRPNLVANGYDAGVRHALERALADVSPVAQQIAERCLIEHRREFGLGEGSADLIGSCAGRFFGLELKTPTGRLKPSQERWIPMARGRGCFVEVVRSADEAVEALRRLRSGGT